MEDIANEQMEATAQPVETEKEIGEKDAEISLGKFKNVNALLNAYNSLEAEFTKRCQKIKELEGELLHSDKLSNPQEDSKREEVKDDKGEIFDKDEVLKEYLKNVLNSKQKAVIMDNGGVGVKTPIERPKTIQEAGLLAKNIL